MTVAAHTIDYSIGECDLGYLLLGIDDQGVCAVFFADQRQQLIDELMQSFPLANISQQEEKLQKPLATLLQCIENPQLLLSMPLSFHGTDFQRAVWAKLQAIPLGETVDYANIAASLNKPKAYRAVASACAANKLAVIVPCHRVIRKNGQPANYRWGLWRKQALLAQERKLLAK